ncbi:MAG: maleylpyruvate isomerase N-terminal domain-containing protein [Phycicoccus sp.]
MDAPAIVVEQYPTVAHTAARLLLQRQVAEHWDEESACAGMTVGALAHHLAGQTTNVVRLVGAAPAGGDVELLDVLGHYRRAAWVAAAVEDDVNVGIRELAEEQASAGGPAQLAARVEADLEALAGALQPVLDGARSPDRVLVPWQGWALPTRDFVLTRAMEVLVHSDDLAASVGVEPPEFPRESADAVLALLASIAATRHGVTAVLRALSRPQRQPRTVAAF